VAVCELLDEITVLSWQPAMSPTAAAPATSNVRGQARGARR
jgi:hypothetical protein